MAKQTSTLETNCSVCDKSYCGTLLTYNEYNDLRVHEDKGHKQPGFPVAFQCRNCDATFCVDCATKYWKYDPWNGKRLQCLQCNHLLLPGKVLVRTIWVLPGLPISYPNVCIHCLQPAQTTIRSDVKVLLNRVNSFPVVIATLETYQAQFFDIPYCQNHAEAMSRYKDVSETSRFVALMVMFATLVVSIFISINIQFLQGLGFLLLLPLLPLVFVMTYSWYIRLKGNPPCVGRGARIGWDGEHIGFAFENPRYSDLFQAANISIVVHK